MLLDIQELHAEQVTRDATGHKRVAKHLNSVSLRVVKGRILGLLGQEGAGEGLLPPAILGLLGPAIRVTGGRILFDGQDMLGLREAERAKLRGAGIAHMVAPSRAALDPAMPIGKQLLQVQAVHRNVSPAEAIWRAETIMSSLGIVDPRARMAAWPHQLTPGLTQRVVLAMALINDPQLLIANEPTAGLDLTVQLQILDLLHVEVRRRRIGAMLVTRDLGVVAQYCDDVAVMFAGIVVEQGPVREVLTRPAHPHTSRLLAAASAPSGPSRTFSTPSIDPYALPDGCLYRPGCDRATDQCATPPPLLTQGVRAARCHFAALQPAR